MHIICNIYMECIYNVISIEQNQGVMNFNDMANISIINLNEITYNKITAILIDLTTIFTVSDILAFLYFLCGVYS